MTWCVTYLNDIYIHSIVDYDSLFLYFFFVGFETIKCRYFLCVLEFTYCVWKDDNAHAFDTDIISVLIVKTWKNQKWFANEDNEEVSTKNKERILYLYRWCKVENYNNRRPPFATVTAEIIENTIRRRLLQEAKDQSNQNKKKTERHKSHSIAIHVQPH